MDNPIDANLTCLLPGMSFSLVHSLLKIPHLHHILPFTSQFSPIRTCGVRWENPSMQNGNVAGLQTCRHREAEPGTPQGTMLSWDLGFPRRRPSPKFILLHVLKSMVLIWFHHICLIRCLPFLPFLRVFFYPLAFSLYLLLSSNMASWKTPHFQTCSMFFSAIYLYLRGGFPAMFLFFPGFALANRMASSSPISMGISHFSSGNRGVSSWIFHFWIAKNLTVPF